MMSDAFAYSHRRQSATFDRAFTLIELLVVIAILSMLLAVIVPSLRKVRHQARLVICSSNLRQIGVGIHSYASEYDETIPFGPEAVPMPGQNFYTATGNVTSLISLDNGDPVGLGLLLDGYLSDQPEVLFCPGTDQPSDADDQLARFGKHQAEGSYYYRHASVALLNGRPDEFHVNLNALGRNRNGRPISALVMDTQFLAHPSLEVWGVMTRTSHRQQACNVYYADGRVVRHDNAEAEFTVDIGSYPYDSLDKILQVFELADERR